MDDDASDVEAVKPLPASVPAWLPGCKVSAHAALFIVGSAVALLPVALIGAVLVHNHWAEVPPAVAAAASQAAASKAEERVSRQLEEHCAFERGRFRWGCVQEGTPLPPPADLSLRPPLARFSLAGVNVGGWLCLEDWFFSGHRGKQVMTEDKAGQGICLPPNVDGLTESPWPSEGILVHRLNASMGTQHTLQAFAAHRSTFIQDKDFKDIAELGLKTVRVPLTWSAFADALKPVNGGVYGSFDPNQDSAIVPDPYYVSEVAHVTIPRDFLAMIIFLAKRHGLRLIFDIHNMPGGHAHGTYNGVYPLQPVFWTKKTRIGAKNMPLTEVGRLIAEKIIQWVEGLDESLLDAVAGLTLMNEPAHMSAIQPETFLVDDEEILSWLSTTADIFRKSFLPNWGVRLYVNIIETAIHDFGCAFPLSGMCGFDAKIPAWWERQFSKEERAKWAVIDLHRYDAWAHGKCDGRWSPGGGYSCSDPLWKMQSKWHDLCVGPWAQKFEEAFPDSLRACSELSGGTHWDPFNACSENKTVHSFIATQAEILQKHRIEPSFWTWRMPSGNNFQGGWSLKWITGREASHGFHCGAGDGDGHAAAAV